MHKLSQSKYFNKKYIYSLIRVIDTYTDLYVDEKNRENGIKIMQPRRIKMLGYIDEC